MKRKGIFLLSGICFIATSTVFTKVSLPRMRKAVSDVNHTCACIATSGITAMMIPAGILAVFCTLFDEQSVSRVLMAGTLPGVVLAICLTLGMLFRVWRNPAIAPSDSTIVTSREKLKSLRCLCLVEIR